MRAAQAQDGKVQITDVPTPQAGPNEALIKMTTAGVCHSDLHLARSDWFEIPGVALPLGHEGIGVVEALGPGAEQYVHEGDRVILGLGGMGGGYWCGACRFCLAGFPRHCTQTRPLMGTFGEYLSVWAPALVKLPDSISDQEAPLACGGLTAYGAVKKLVKYDVMPGRPIAIIGAAGGLGHYAVQLAKAFGYEVVGVDVGKEKLDFVTSLGADRALDASEALATITSDYGGVDASLIFSAKKAGFQLGFDVLGPRGLMVCVGIPANSEGNIEFNPWNFFLKDAIVIYSAVGTVQDMRELVDLAAKGKVKTHVSRTAPLSDIADVFDELEAAKYLGRAVLTDLAH